MDNKLFKQSWTQVDYKDISRDYRRFLFKSARELSYFDIEGCGLMPARNV